MLRLASVSGSLAAFFLLASLSHATGDVPGRAAGYQLTLLGAAPGEWSTAAGCNESGLVVGAHWVGNYTHASVWQDGAWTDLGVAPGAIGIAGSAVNASGALALYGFSPQFTLQAFRFQSGAFEALPSLGGPNAAAWAIDSVGNVYGTADVSPAGPAVAVRWDTAGVAHSLGSLGGAPTVAFGVNDAGTVVGSSMKAGSQLSTPFVHRATGMRPLPIPSGYLQGLAVDVEAHDVIVGWATDSLTGQPMQAPVMWIGDQARVLAVPPGVKSAVATAVNDFGQAVGYGVDTREGILWQNGQATSLSALVAVPAGWSFLHVTGIDDSGRIVGWGSLGARRYAFELEPRMANFDRDARIDELDLRAFQIAFVSGSPRADVDRDGFVGDADRSAFVRAYALER